MLSITRPVMWSQLTIKQYKFYNYSLEVYYKSEYMINSGVLNLLSETFEKSAMLKDRRPANWLHTTQSSYPKIDVERSGAGWTWCVLLKPVIIQLCQDVEMNSMHSLHITILWYKCMHKNEWYIRLINMCNIIAICFNTTLKANTQTYLPVKISGLQCSLLLKMNQLQVYVNVNLKVYFSWTTID